MSAQTKAILAAFTAHMLWGAGTPLFKLSFADIPPITFAAIRFWFTAILLLGYLFYKKTELSFTRKDFLITLAVGISITAHIGLYFFGLSLSNGLNTSIIVSMSPIVTVFFAFLFHKEEISSFMLMGIGIAFIGGLIIIGQPILSLGIQNKTIVIGNIILFISVIMAVISAFFLKTIAKKYPSTHINAVIFSVGFLLFLPFAFLEYRQQPLWINSLSYVSGVGIIYAVVGNSVLAYFLYTKAYQTLKMTQVETSAYIMPVIGVLLSTLILGEKMSVFFVVGAIVTAFGIFLAESRHPQHPLHRKHLLSKKRQI